MAQQYPDLSLPTLVLSSLNLSNHKKDKLFEMLICQNPTFTRNQDGNYSSTLRLPDHVIESILFPKKSSNQVPGSSCVSSSQQPESPTSTKPAKKKQHIPAGDLEIIIQSLQQRYPRFSSYFNPRPPKPHAPTWTIKIINEIFEYRYLKEIEVFESNEQYERSEKLELSIFPDFAVEYFAKIYGLQSLLHQNCWDFLYNVELYRRKYLALETFAKFLSEEYDSDDLQFFLYAKSVVEKELTKRVIPARTKTQFVTPQRASQLAKMVFASNTLTHSFTQLVDSFISLKQRSQQVGIDINELLMLFLLQYHKTRPDVKSNESNAEDRTEEISQSGNENHDSLEDDVNEGDDVEDEESDDDSEPTSTYVELQKQNEELVRVLSDRMAEGWFDGKDSNSDSDVSNVSVGSISDELGIQLSIFLAAQFPMTPGESEQIFASEFLAGLVSTISAYLDSLLQDCTPSLPAPNLSAIRAEAETHLQTMLSSFLENLQTESLESLKQKSRDAEEHNELLIHREDFRRKLHKLQRHPFTRGDDEHAVECRHEDVAAFCSTMVGAPEVRNRFEPLVAYLVQATYRSMSSS